jgi:hypothetical protein
MHDLPQRTTTTRTLPRLLNFIYFQRSIPIWIASRSEPDHSDPKADIDPVGAGHPKSELPP